MDNTDSQQVFSKFAAVTATTFVNASNAAQFAAKAVAAIGTGACFDDESAYAAVVAAEDAFAAAKLAFQALRKASAAAEMAQEALEASKRSATLTREQCRKAVPTD